MKTAINKLPKRDQVVILRLISREKLRRFCVAKDIRRGKDKAGTIKNIINSGVKLTVRAEIRV